MNKERAELRIHLHYRFHTSLLKLSLFGLTEFGRGTVGATTREVGAD